MAKSLADEIGRLCEPHGLRIFSELVLSANQVPGGLESESGKVAFLIGNAGRDMWSRFVRSPEYADSGPDSLDRWTRRVIDELASELEAKTAYPFDRPFWPFQRIAMQSMGVRQSPLGLLIHHKFGLWHAYRGLLFFDFDQKKVSHHRGLEEKACEEIHHPCEDCEDKPCISACPVDAFGDGIGVNRAACLGHIETRSEPDCLESGCRSRDACPVGREWRYTQDQVQFHMAAFAGRAN